MTLDGDFQPEQQWHETSAGKWNELFREVKDWRQLKSSLLPILRRFQAGLAGQYQRVTVALVERPEILNPATGQPFNPRRFDDHYMARRIRYRDLVPTEGSIEFTGAPFKVYPNHDSELDDFNSMVWSEPEPRHGDTMMLMVRREFGAWLIEQPQSPGAEKLVVLRALRATVEPGPEDPGSRFVVVQEVSEQLDESGQWTGEYRPIGNAQVVNCWPPLTAGYFRPYLWPVDPFSGRTTFLPLTRYGGVWYLKQRNRMAVVRRQGTVKALDCAAVTEPNP